MIYKLTKNGISVSCYAFLRHFPSLPNICLQTVFRPGVDLPNQLKEKWVAADKLFFCERYKHAHIHVHVCVYLHTHTRIYIYIHTYTYAYMHTHMMFAFLQTIPIGFRCAGIFLVSKGAQRCTLDELVQPLDG